MAKTIKIKTTNYQSYADVVYKDDEGLHIANSFEGLELPTRSKRDAIADIKRYFTENGKQVIAVDNITTYKRVYVTTYTVNASNSEIVDACFSAGLDIDASITTLVNSDESEEDTEE